MRKTSIIKELTFTCFTFLLTIPLFATDGYFSVGYGAMSKGMGGVGVSLYHVSLINGNPAGNVFLGNQYSIGVAIFNPNREYTITGNPSGMPGTFGLVPGTVESESKVFVVPNIGANWSLGDNHAFGIALYGNGGMNTNYPTRTFYDQSIESTGVNLAQLFASFTYSIRLIDQVSAGISAITAYQWFAAEGLSNFANFSSDPARLTNNDSDNSFGFGGKIGVMANLTDQLVFGASYQSKILMAEFDDYAGLFAEEGDFDIPAAWTVGLSYDLEPVTLAFDLKQILYSGVNAVSNPMDVMSNAPADQMGNPNPNFQPLGTENGWGFGWEDMTVYKFGIELEASQNLTLRGGYSYGKSPVPESEVLFNILAPGVIENHVTFGLSNAVGNQGNKVHLSLNYAFNNTVSGNNPLDFSFDETTFGLPNQQIDLKMNQFEIEIGFTF